MLIGRLYRLYRLYLGLCVGFLGLAPAPLSAQNLFLVEPSPTKPLVSAGNLTLAWTASPDTNAMGYYLCWGLTRSACTNRLDAGSSTTVTVGGLAPRTSYYFIVVEYSPAGITSLPSNLLPYHPAPTLSVGPTGGHVGAGVSLGFSAETDVVYYLEATQDFQHWVPVLITNCATPNLISFLSVDSITFSRRFYRLAQRDVMSFPPAPRLTLQGRGGAGVGGVSFRFQANSGMLYYLQATEDFKGWVTVASTNCTATGPITFLVGDTLNYPKRFYRLIQE